MCLIVGEGCRVKHVPTDTTVGEQPALHTHTRHSSTTTTQQTSTPTHTHTSQAMAVQMAGLSEALALGAAMGLDPGKLTSVINSSSGRCWASDTYNPVPVRV